jgi:hypothetical protein
MCLLPRAPGPCQDRIPKWYFDNFEKRCMPFYYGGCEGTGLIIHLLINQTKLYQEMVTNLTVKKNASNHVLLNSCKLIFARLKKRLDHAGIWLSAFILILKWELVKSFTLEDVKVV